MEIEKSSRSRGVIVKQVPPAEPVLKYCQGCTKLSSYNWVEDVPRTLQVYDIVEVQFKNTRKAFFRNANQLHLNKGDIVAVEASPGHDIGVVSLTGWLVLRQLKKLSIDPTTTEFKKIYRKAKPVDTEKWLEAIALEHTTMIKARRIAENLQLNMKIGDVEYQGDKTKAIFYYIADERVDFRELIKILAEEFKIRVEMRQIGARQEAGRIGGIGSCGRELCCSTFVTNFISVTTNSARIQEISLNPQKLAGQCSKLKCCLNYELDCYVDARKDFPEITVPLETLEATYHHFKTDIYNRTMWYSTDPNSPVNPIPVPVERVVEILELNRKGVKANKLLEAKPESKIETQKLGFHNVIEEESLTRFDERSQPRKKKKKHRHRKHDNNASE